MSRGAHGLIRRLRSTERGVGSRYRGVNTQNSLPSGSAITTQLTWP